MENSVYHLLQNEGTQVFDTSALDLGAFVGPLAEVPPLTFYVLVAFLTGVVGLLLWQYLRQLNQLTELREKELNRTIQISRAITVGRISASLAHDLRQPISAILLNAQGAMRLIRQSESKVEGLSESMTDIVSDVSRMDNLVESLRGLLEPEQKPAEKLDANDEILSTVNLLKGKLLKMSIGCQTKLANDLPDITWIRSDFRQLVATLLLDAMDSMTDSTREDRSIQIRSTKGADDSIILRFQDHGSRTPLILKECLRRSVDPHLTDEASIHMRSSVAILKRHTASMDIQPSSSSGVSIQLTLPTRTKSKL